MMGNQACEKSGNHSKVRQFSETYKQKFVTNREELFKYKANHAVDAEQDGKNSDEE